MTGILHKRPLALIGLILAQVFCAGFFVSDVITDGFAPGFLSLDPHLILELLATFTLVLAVILEVHLLRGLLLRNAHLETQMAIAAGAFHDILHDHFAQWKLTPAEQDVALFTVKGLSITEIADLRGSAEGTIKSHLNAIYRKSGVAGKSALLSLFIEDLMTAPLVSNQGQSEGASTPVLG